MTSAVEALAADPHAVYAMLRQSAPVHRVTLPDGSPVWLVTRYEDVRAGLADPRLSLDKRNSSGGWAGFSLPPRLDANLLNMDAPDHTRIRRLVAPAFTARRVEALRPRIEEIARQLLAGLGGDVDLVGDYATPLSIAVICELLGVDDADVGQLRDWTTTLLSPPPDDPRAAARAVVAIEAFLVDLIARKRAAPGEDLLTAMVAARDLSEDELTSLAFLTIFAGYENSINLIGNCVLLLLQRPELLAEVRASPEARRAAVDETLRFEPAAPLAIRRFARTELTYGDVTVPAGATVLMGIAAANRDPAVVDDPESFRLRRPSAPHLGLGHGPHHCLGAALAVLEADVAVGALLERPVTLAGDVAWRRSFRTRALVSLPVKLP